VRQVYTSFNGAVIASVAKGAMRCKLQLPRRRRKKSARLSKSISMPGKALMNTRFLPTIHARNLVAVEWSFEAVHSGPFANIAATGKQVEVLGCSFYEYDLGTRTIPAGRIYFDLGTLLRQIAA
jgi:hypothetical protein